MLLNECRNIFGHGEIVMAFIMWRFAVIPQVLLRGCIRI